MSLASLCNTTCTITRKSATSDSYGGHTESFAAIYSGIRATLQPASGATIEQWARLSMQISHVIYTDTVLSLKAGDVATVGAKKYLVQSWGDSGGRGKVFAVYVLEKD